MQKQKYHPLNPPPAGDSIRKTMNPNHDYNKILQPYANDLRKNMTKAEACLWKYVLKAGKMRGYKFRRQRPVLNYIADFMCFDLKLVIEVDGYTHLLAETIEKDKVKTRDLENAGYHVLRFSDEEVLTGIWNVARSIEQYVEDYEKLHPLAPR
jgi:very-short-patch-repair endonuclease